MNPPLLAQKLRFFFVELRVKRGTSKAGLPLSTQIRKPVFGFSLYCLAALLQADIVYVAAGGRVSQINSQTGQRSVASGWILPASAFVAIDPVAGDFYTADQADRAVYRVNRTNGIVSLVSGIGVGTGQAFSDRVFGIAVETNGSPVVVDGIDGRLAVIRVSPQTGNRTVLSAGANSSVPAGSGLSFQSPFGIAVENSGNLLVTDISRNAVIRVDRVSGNRSLLSGDPFEDNAGSGPDMNSPKGIAVRTDGAIFISDSGGGPYPGRVVQINPTNGNRRIAFSQSNRFNTWGGDISSISLATNGLVVAPFQLTANGFPAGGKVWGINLLTSNVTTISTTGDGFFSNESVGTGQSFFNPVGIAVDLNGRLIISDVLVRSIFSVDPTTGNRDVLPNSRMGDGPDLYSAKGVALGTNGFVVVVDDGDSTAFFGSFPDIGAYVNRWPLLLEMNPNTGGRSLLSAGSNTGVQRGTGSNFDSPQGVARENAGTFVVADSGSRNPKVVRVDPATGNRTILSSSSVGTGTKLISPYAIVVENSGSIIVTDSGLNAVLRITPDTGNRSVLSGSSQGTGTTFLSLKGAALLDDGSIAVVDSSRSTVFRVDPDSGNRTIISDASHGTGPGFGAPRGAVAETSGKLLVIDSSSGSVIRVDLVTGNRTVVTDSDTGGGPRILSPEFLVVAPPLKLTAPNRLRDGTIQFNLLSPVGRNCLVEWSTNLPAWNLLTRFATTSATNIVTDAAAASQNSKFYRARIIP